MLALLWIAAPSLPEIVSRTAAAMAHAPTHAVCHAESEQLRLGKNGAVDASERAAFERTLSGGTHEDSLPSQRWRDDQALSAEQVTEINGRATVPRNDTLDERLLSPFFALASHDFALLREDTLWGHHVYVLQVTAKKDDGANGTVWIDADTFLELKGELTPLEPPRNVDSLSWQEQFERLADGSVVRTLMHIEGRGHFLFFKAATRFTSRMISCAL